MEGELAENFDQNPLDLPTEEHTPLDRSEPKKEKLTEKDLKMVSDYFLSQIIEGIENEKLNEMAQNLDPEAQLYV